MKQVVYSPGSAQSMNLEDRSVIVVGQAPTDYPEEEPQEWVLNVITNKGMVWTLLATEEEGEAHRLHGELLRFLEDDKATIFHVGTFRKAWDHSANSRMLSSIDEFIQGNQPLDVQAFNRAREAIVTVMGIKKQNEKLQGQLSNLEDEGWADCFLDEDD